jgi:phage recombination protein Bet
MTTQVAIVKRDEDSQAHSLGREFNRDEIDLIKQTVAVGATDAELKLFLYTCQRRGLDPLVKHVYFIKRSRKVKDDNGKDTWEKYGVIQTGIDGFRLVAERTGRYDGQLGPFWCGEDGKWVDVWLSSKPPSAAKVAVLKRGWREPLWGVARWSAYFQEGPMWTKMGAEQLAKCAEALALRKAFPEDLSGLYTNDEMMQADNPPPPPPAHNRVTGEIVEGHVVEQPRRLPPIPAILDGAPPPPPKLPPPAENDDVPADLPNTPADLVRLVDAHRAQHGKALFSSEGDKAMFVAMTVIKNEGIPAFQWGMLKDAAARAQAYRILMAHERKSEKQPA